MSSVRGCVCSLLWALSPSAASSGHPGWICILALPDLASHVILLSINKAFLTSVARRVIHTPEALEWTEVTLKRLLVKKQPLEPLSHPRIITMESDSRAQALLQCGL